MGRSCWRDACSRRRPALGDRKRPGLDDLAESTLTGAGLRCLHFSPPDRGRACARRRWPGPGTANRPRISSSDAANVPVMMPSPILSLIALSPFRDGPQGLHRRAIADTSTPAWCSVEPLRRLPAELYERREFVTLLGAAVAGRIPRARNRQQGCRPSDSSAPARRRLDPMDQRFSAAAARTRLDRRPKRRDRVSLGGRTRRREAEIAAEFVRLKVEVILTVGGTVAASRTSDIPIVVAISADPLGTGLVASLARPAATSPACRSRRPTLPASGWKSCAKLSPVSVAWRSWPMSPSSPSRWRWAPFRQRPYARPRSHQLEIRRAEDIAPALESIKGRAEALYVPPNPLSNANRVHINDLALARGCRRCSAFGNMSKAEA